MQFLLKEKPDKEGLIRLCGEDYHYLVHVRRLKPGAVFQALLPSSVTAAQHVKVTVINIDKHTLTGSVIYTDNAALNTELPPVILFQALPKGTKMDLIVRQAAETGISEIVPFISEHSVQKESSGNSRIDRWTRIVKEARQQSLSAVDTRVHKILVSDELFAYWEELQSKYPAATVYSTEPQSVLCGDGSPLDGGEENASGGVLAEQKIHYSKSTGTPILNNALGLLFTPSAGTPILNNPLEQGGFHRYLNNKLPLLVLAVGPEGGFSTAESGRFINAGFKAIRLSDTVLRTETAALYGAAAAKIILMERAWWKTALQ